jgi:hypothetical protein
MNCWLVATFCLPPHHDYPGSHHSGQHHQQLSKQDHQDAWIANIRNPTPNEKILQLNAALVPSTLGGGAHGYLGLILSNAFYGVKSGNDATNNPKLFIGPIFPGNQPTIIGKNTAALRVFGYQAYAWRMYSNVHQMLQTIVLDAIKDTNLSPIKSQVGYRNVSVVAVLTHLFKEYAATTPYSAIQILSQAKQLVSETGLFHDDGQQCVSHERLDNIQNFHACSTAQTTQALCHLETNWLQPCNPEND